MLKLAHESELAGHFSTKKTVSSILAECWWPDAKLIALIL